MSGWIKLHRKTLENPVVCKDSDHIAIWVYLLLHATHKEFPALFKGEKIMLQPGQLITGRKSISSELKIDESKVTRILKSLENEQQIEQQTSNKNRLITVLSWDKYQNDEQQNEQEVNNKRTTTEQQVNTNKNVKNIKNDKNVKKKDKTAFEDYTSNPDLLKSLESFIEFRKKIKKPMTDHAIKLLLGKLNKLANDETEKIAILEQSILSGWQDVYALKSDSASKYQSGKLTKPNIPIAKGEKEQPISEQELAEIRELARKIDEGG